MIIFVQLVGMVVGSLLKLVAAIKKENILKRRNRLIFFS